MKTHVKIISSLLLIIISMPAFSQMLGNPAAVQGVNAWSVSASMGYLRHQEGNYENMTRRMVLKSRYAITSWMDVFGVFGGFKLRRLIDSNTIDDYEGAFSLGYGGGLNLSKDHLIGNITGWFSGHFVRFPSKGEYMENFITGGGWSNSIEYDTREYQLMAGFKIPSTNWNFYAGGVVWGVQRLEEQKIYLVSTDHVKSNTPYSTSEGTYQSGAWTGAVLGIELKLPKHYSAGIEFIGFNERNYQIMFGVSQTTGLY